MEPTVQWAPAPIFPPGPYPDLVRNAQPDPPRADGMAASNISAAGVVGLAAATAEAKVGESN